MLVILLAGGAGERLYPLTKERAKPAVYFGGPYRIIDFTLSNCINSGLRRIFIAHPVQVALPQPPHPHGVEHRVGGARRVHRDPAARRSGSASTGTSAPPTRCTRTSTRSCARTPRHVIVLSGDHIYKMDYAKMLRFHVEKSADVTLATIEVPVADGRRFGIVSIDEHDRVRRLPREAGRTAPAPGSPDVALASMGIYIFNTDVLVRALEADAAQPDSQHDFGKNIIPALIAHGAGLLLPVLRREQEGREVLARHRHARRLLRGEHGPVPGQSRVQPLRSRSGRCAPTSRRRRRPSSCSPRKAGAAARRSTRSSRRLHRLRQPRRRQHPLPERPGPQLLRHRAERS